ncbi:MAG TPA: helix-turn-helix transcriptional regulator [Thermomicrobiales bacterium]|jgi:transcriptional regulator with XRE-family HTH domain
MNDPRIALLEKFRDGRTQTQFANLLGIDQSTLSLIMAGKRGPNIALLGLIKAFPDRAPEIAAALSTTAVGAEREVVSA